LLSNVFKSSVLSRKDTTFQDENDTLDFLVEFEKIKININVDDFCKDNNLDPTFIEVMDDIYSTSKFGKIFCPSVEGGFLRRWFNGEKYTETTCDMDFFFVGLTSKNLLFHETRENFKNFLVNNYDGINIGEHSVEKNYDMEITLNNKHQKVQLMAQYFSNIVADRYDINYGIMKNILHFDTINSMIGYNAQKRTLVMHENFTKFNREKLVVFNTSDTHNTSHPLRIFDRFEKFVKDGYVQPESRKYKVAMLNHIANKKNKFSDPDLYPT
jgi:hypothetical protein